MPLQYCGQCPQGQASLPLTSLFRRFLLFRGLRWVIIVTAVGEAYGTVVPILSQRFAQSFVFFLLNKNETFINKNGRLLSKTSDTSRVQLSVKHTRHSFQSLFEEKIFLQMHTWYLLLCTFASTCLPTDSRIHVFYGKFLPAEEILGLRTVLKIIKAKTRTSILIHTILLKKNS